MQSLELLILLILILINGLLSMTEAAVITSRKVRLQQRAEKGDQGAEAALELAEQPTRFLSTVQIGITLIGVITGAFGGATLAEEIGQALHSVEALAPYADVLGFVIVVAVTTYFSLILGELVPKRLALRSPERIASLMARPMMLLSRISAPLVTLLAVSTDFVLRLLGARGANEQPITEEEITAMLQQGVEAGVFVEAETEMVEGVFRLGDQRVSALMTPRTEIVWLDVDAAQDVLTHTLRDSGFSRYPVADGDLDRVLGIVQAKDLLVRALAEAAFDLRAAMIEPLYVPESLPASVVLERFKTTGVHLALVIGEYGGLQGLVTIQDLLEEIVGDIEQPQAVQRDDGSWLLDGMLAVNRFKEILEIEDELPDEHEGYETLGGFVMNQLGRIPSAADTFAWQHLRFEVVDMDGNRVDKVLVIDMAPSDGV